MKKLILITLLLLVAQSCTKSNAREIEKPKTSINTGIEDSIKLIKDNKLLPNVSFKGRHLFQSVKGATFVIVKSKKGNYYKKYIPK